MPRTDPITRYGLYGDAILPRADDFVHSEDIPSRSRLHGWRIEPHVHPGMVQLVFLSGGGARFSADDAAAVLHPGAVALIPAGCVHGFDFDPGTQGWVLTLAAAALSHPHLHGEPALAGLFDRLHVRTPDPATAQRLDRFFAELHACRTGVRVRPASALFWWIGLILTELLPGDPPTIDPARASGQADLVAAYRRLIEDHYRDRWPIDRFLETLGISRGVLARACHAVTGRPPGEMLLDRTMIEARRYLAYTSAASSQIAYQLGYDDPAYFSRLFRKRIGSTPMAYRRACNRGGAERNVALQ